MIPDSASLWVAARRFEALLKKDPASYSFAPLSEIYRKLGLLEDAVEAARKGVATHPAFAAGQMALARAALECGFKSESMTALEAVVSITPENIEAQRLLADLYSAAGKQDAALRCLAIANSLDIDYQEPVAPPVQAAAVEPPEEEAIEEEILDADILELSDEFIEEVDFEEEAASPFAALPDRPSLGDDFSRAEPFLMETPPPIYHEEPATTEPSPVMLTATIAELYVSQGFTDKGVDVYRQLLAVNPSDESYKKRLAELTETSTPAAAAEVVEQMGFAEKLQEWLGNIGRVRECRTRNL